MITTKFFKNYVRPHVCNTDVVVTCITVNEAQPMLPVSIISKKWVLDNCVWDLQVRVSEVNNTMTLLYTNWAYHMISRLWWQILIAVSFKFQVHNTSSSSPCLGDQGISWAKRRYHDNEETLNKCRQLQKVQTQTGSRGSPPRVNKEESQRAFKMAPQSIHNGEVAGGGSCVSEGWAFCCFAQTCHVKMRCWTKCVKKQHYDYKIFYIEGFIFVLPFFGCVCGGGGGGGI